MVLPGSYSSAFLDRNGDDQSPAAGAGEPAGEFGTFLMKLLRLVGRSEVKSRNGKRSISDQRAFELTNRKNHGCYKNTNALF